MVINNRTNEEFQLEDEKKRKKIKTRIVSNIRAADKSNNFCFVFMFIIQLVVVVVDNEKSRKKL